MEIKVYGPGCSTCKKTLNVVEAAVNAAGIDATVTKVTEFQEIARLGIISTPTVVIDNEIKCTGRVPKPAEVEAWIS